MNLENTLLKAPCIFCGYNGKEFYQSGTHASACPYYSIGGYNERKEMIGPYLADIVKLYMEDVNANEQSEEGKIIGKSFLLYDGRAKTGGPDAASVYVTASTIAEAVTDAQDEAWQDGIWYEYDQWDDGDGVVTLINGIPRWDLPPANKREGQ